MSAPASTSPTPLGAWPAVRLVAGREITTRVRSKAFLLTTALLVVGVVLGGFLLDLASGGGPSAQRVGVVVTAGSSASGSSASGSSTSGTDGGADQADQADPADQTEEGGPVGAALTAAADAAGLDVDASSVADRAAGEQEVRDGDLDALVVAGQDGTVTVVVAQDLDPTLEAVLTGTAQSQALAAAVERLGGDPAAVAQEVGAAHAQVERLEPADERDAGQVVAGFVAGILTFVALMTCGQLVAQGVVEEKTSRVVELLLATVRPWQLMAGKVLGIGAIGLAQVALVVAAGAGTATALGLLDASSLALGPTIVWSLVWFVVGFTMFALALAALAALVSRQEDVGSVTSPVITLMMVPYILGVSIAPWDPDNTLVVALSFVPFCAPLLMPIRIALGAVEPWEPWVALGLSVALVPVLVWLAGRVYAHGVLRTGGRVRLKDALRAG